MTVLIPILIGFLVVGCGEGNQINKKSPKATASKNSWAEPVKELTLKEKIVGFYEGRSNQDTNRLRLVLWENGEVESYRNGKKRSTANWKINKNGKLNVEVKEKSEEVLFAFRINPDGSLTGTTATMDGKHKVLSKKDQITLAKLREGAKGSPPTVESMLAFIGRPLSKDEENFVGRRKGSVKVFDSTGYSSKSYMEVVYRRDHTYSVSTIYRDNPNVEEECAPDEAVVEVESEVEEEVAHGIWRIIGDQIYFLDLVFNKEKFLKKNLKVIEAILIVSDKKSYSFTIPESKDEKGQILPSWKYKEEPTVKFKHPGMWPYNSPNGLESFDLLTAYKYAKEPESFNEEGNNE